MYNEHSPNVHIKKQQQTNAFKLKPVILIVLIINLVWKSLALTFHIKQIYYHTIISVEMFYGSLIETST